MADNKLAYAASATIGKTLASLASDANLLAGRETDAVSNATNKYLDFYVGGQIRTGTSPTADKTIRVYAHGAYEDTPAYHDVLTGIDAAATLTNTKVRNSILKLVASMAVTADSNVDYGFGPVSIRSLFGGVLPTHWGLWIVHDTAAALNATETNHFIYQTGIYRTV